jgi:homoserine kinase type II
VRRAISTEEIQAVLAHYEAGSVVPPPEPGGGTANSNLKVSTTCGTYFLKRRNPKYAQESFVAFDHALMEHMAAYRVGTPLAVLTREGRCWLRLGENVYELFPYQHGGPHDRHSVAQIASAGRALANYHRAARSFSPPPGKEWPRYDDPRLIRAGIEAIITDLERQLSVDDMGYLMNEIALLERELPDDRYDTLPKLVVHGDYHPGNIKFTNDDVSGIFDLDWATLQPRLRDLADGLFLFAGERESDIDDANIYSLTQTWQPSLERARAFMACYLESETLGEEESDALPLFIRARWLCCRVAGMAKVAPERRIEYLVCGLLSPLRALDTMNALF